MAKITSSCKICGKPFIDGEIRGDIDICRDCYRAQKEQKAIETIYRNGNEIEEIHYREYKTNYANCETIKGSYNAETKTIKVIVPNYDKKVELLDEFFGEINFVDQDGRKWENLDKNEKIKYIKESEAAVGYTSVIDKYKKIYA